MKRLIKEIKMLDLEDPSLDPLPDGAGGDAQRLLYPMQRLEH
jgi:hypothetical protein